MGPPELITIDEARERVLAAVRALEVEDVPLEQALGRVLAADAVADHALPPFDASAMDGYAVPAGEAARLAIVGESRAGAAADRMLQDGEAIRISTGAITPAGAWAVVPVERAELGDGAVTVPASREGQNIRRAGEDLQEGELAIRAGAELRPAELAMLASLGRPLVRCARRPRVAVLATGDELVEPGDELAPGQIRNSNTYGLAAEVTRAGGEVVMRARVPDDASATRAALEQALEEADVVCVTGGVSVGPHDHVKGALGELGVEQGFWGVRLQPGKPTWFGTRGDALVFGLPGNPVSAMVTFHLFARPALRALQGAEPIVGAHAARLGEPVSRNPGRDQMIRVRLDLRDDGWHALPTKSQQSHVLSSMLGADALARIPAGEGDIARGDRVDIELL